MIDKTTLESVAKLARLSLTENEASDYADQLSKVLEYFDQISIVDTRGVEPLITPIEIQGFLREDEVVQLTTAEEVIANAPEKTGNLFTVPPVV